MNDFVMMRIPRDLYNALVARAAAEHRSATAQAVVMLEQALRPEPAQPGRQSEKAA